MIFFCFIASLAPEDKRVRPSDNSDASTGAHGGGRRSCRYGRDCFRFVFYFESENDLFFLFEEKIPIIVRNLLIQVIEITVNQMQI